MATTPTHREKLNKALDNLLGQYIAPEVLIAELDDILASRPTQVEVGNNDEHVMAWMGRVKAALIAWDAGQSAMLPFIESRLYALASQEVERGYRELLALIHQARASLRLRITPTSVVAGKGMVFEYFDGVRKIVESATSDTLFVDPYLDADFVARYLAYVPAGVPIRLLTREKLATLLPAVDTFAAQHQEKVQVRSTDKIHDRYVFVDGKECFQSGASFKDGARNAPTTLTQITDAFAAVQQTYENIWAAAKVER